MQATGRWVRYYTRQEIESRYVIGLPSRSSKRVVLCDFARLDCCMLLVFLDLLDQPDPAHDFFCVLLEQ
jgi:hypothetical protein